MTSVSSGGPPDTARTARPIVTARRRTWVVAAAGVLGLATASVATALTGVAGDAAAAGAGPATCGSNGVLSGSATLVCTYDTVGSDTFTVPAGVTQLAVSVTGAAGGHYFIDGDAMHPDPSGAITGRPGGAGGAVSATLAVSPRQAIQIDVAGRGVNGTASSRSNGMKNGPSGGAGAPGGFGGSDGGLAGGPGDARGAAGGTAASNGGNGSGGGGSSDVRIAAAGCASLTCGPSDRVLVAAGGGGGGGTGGTGNAIGGAGGAGGGATGSDGGATVDGGTHGVSGAGASPTTGGAGGLESGLHAPGAVPTDPRYGGDGAGGSIGVGGGGGHGNKPCTGTQVPACPSPPSTTSGGGAGGGGGAGLYGGGGGSGGGGTFGGGGGAGGGGGGGSSFAVASASDAVLTAAANCDPTTLVACSPTVNAGNGQVTVTWTPPTPASPALSTTAPAAIVVGAQSAATATLSGGSQPSGTITFNLYGPGDASCQTPVASSTASVTGDDAYQATAVAVTTAGTYRWVAGYSGDSGNAAVTGTCAGAALVVVASGAPTVGTNPGTPTTPTAGTNPGSPTTPTIPGGGSGTGGSPGSGGAGSGGAGGGGTGGGAPRSGAATVKTSGHKAPASSSTAAPSSSSPAGARATASSPTTGSPPALHGTHDVSRRTTPITGVLIDAPSGATAGASPAASPLSTAQLETDSSGDDVVAGSSVGWVGGGLLLVLLGLGVLLEADLPFLRRTEAGTP
jgi:hypothetical protein